MSPTLPRTAALLSCIFTAGLVATPAMAQEEGFGDEGFYLSTTIAADFANSGEFDGIQAPVAGAPGTAGDPAAVAVDYDTGFSVRGAVGYEFKRGLFIKNLVPRVELEFEYAENDVDDGSFNGTDQIFGGEITRYAVSVSVYNDIRWAADQKFVPFFGSGLGIGVVEADIASAPAAGGTAIPEFLVTGDESSFTTHSSIGAAYEINEKIDVFVEGRYTDYRNGTFQRLFVGDGSGSFTADVEGDTEIFSAGLGLRVRF